MGERIGLEVGEDVADTGPEADNWTEDQQCRVVAAVVVVAAAEEEESWGLVGSMEDAVAVDEDHRSDC